LVGHRSGVRFVFLHANKIELPGIQFDEIIFVDAAEATLTPR
jgi:hypothetical protein